MMHEVTLDFLQRVLEQETATLARADRKVEELRADLDKAVEEADRRQHNVNDLIASITRLEGDNR